MKQQSTARFLIILLLIFILSAACRQQPEETPTPAPTPPPAAVTPAPDIEPLPPEVIDWPPQLIYSSPVPGEEVLLKGAITLRFDQPMDRQSVESALSVERADGAAVSGDLSWPRPDTLIFTPLSDLERRQSYLVHVADVARGQNGQPLRAPIDLSLETVGYLEVSQTIPADGTREVESDAAITVIFNRPVVPLVATAQQADLPQPLRFNPPVAGQGQWTSTSIYRFLPDEPLAGATRYEVAVAAGLEDVTGGLLEEAYTWSFNTLQPNVVSVEPFDSAQESHRRFGLTDTITVTFNMPMERSSAENAITFRPAVPLRFNWSDDNRAVGVTPQTALELDSDYAFTVGRSARAARGTANLQREFETTLRTVPLPAVRSVEPSDGSIASRWQRGVAIEFVSPMDLQTLEDRILVQPAPERINYYYDDYNYRLFLDFELARSTQYQVTAPADAADPYGNTLGAAYTWRFTTPPPDPLASFNLPEEISQLSTSYPTVVEIIHRNVSQINVQLFELGLRTDLIMDRYQLRAAPPLAPPLRAWSLPLAVAQNEVGVEQLPLADGNVLPTGVYYLQLNAPELDENTRWWQNQSNVVIVADTNLVVKEMFGAVHVWATDLASGEPVAGRNLTLYDRRGRQIGGGVTTDNNGFARFDYEPGDTYLEGVLVVSNEPGAAGFGMAGSDWNRNAVPWRFGIDGNSREEPTWRVYLHTDRPIYRPGDTVHFRGVARAADYGRYTLPGLESIAVSMSYYSYIDDYRFEEKQEYTLAADGIFSGEFVIPEDARLGEYRLVIDHYDLQTERIFTVAQYRAPEFMVTATPHQEELLRGQANEVTIEAGYFFGGPAADLEVQWTIYEKTYRFPWDGPYYSFGDDGGLLYESDGPFFFGGGSAFGDFIRSGSGRTDENGRLVVSLPADLLEDVAEGSRRITVEANVTDVSGFPVASRAHIVYHAAETYVGVAPNNYIGAAGRPSSVNLVAVDWDGRAMANQEIEVVFYRREWRPVRAQQFNMYYTRWEVEDSEVARQVVSGDAQGRAQASFTPQSGGSYLAVATVSDQSGRQHWSSTGFWISDPSFVGWRSDPRERRMELTANQSEYRPGDTARILVQSPFAGPVKAWLTIERGRLIEQRVITLETNSDVLELPITPNLAPNAFVTIVAVKGVDEENAYADIRLGMVELVVSPEQLELNVEMTPRQARYAPGDTAVFDILVTDFRGEPVEADLSLALVDLAVLTLKPDNAPHILDAFYQRQPYRSRVGAGLFYSGEGLEVEVPLEAGGLGGGGGELALAEAVLLSDEEEEDDVRRDFRDTAYWEANVTSDADGQLTVEIPLPDNLTTWRLSGKAVTAETLVGQSDADIVSTLPLLIRPVTPRFFTVGDALKIGAIVHNNSGQALDLTVTLEAAGLSLNDPAEQRINLADGGRRLAQWEATVNDVQFADLTFRVAGGGLSDASKPTFGVGPDQLIPVYRYTARDIVGTSGILDDAGRRVEAILLPPDLDERQGEVSVSLSPSLAAALIETLDALEREEYPLACAFSVIDHLMPNIAVAGALRALDLDDPALTARLAELVPDGLAHLATLQLGNGGWGWCYSSESDSLLTAYILLGLSRAQEAGYDVNETMLRRATQYVSDQVRPPARLGDRYEANRQAFFLYVLAQRDAVNEAALNALFTEQRSVLDPYAKGMMALAYESVNAGAANQQALLSDLNNSVVISAAGAHWQDAEPDWRNLNSNIRGTAIILSALAQLDPDNVLSAQAANWLMAARSANIWSSPQENVWSVIALTDWMAATGELNPNYSYQLNVNNAPLDSGAFSRANVAESSHLSVPLNTLVLDGVNFFDFQRSAGDGRLYYSAYLDSYVSADSVSALNRGFIVQRVYYDADCRPAVENCQPISQIRAGQQVRVELTIILPHDRFRVIVEDYLPAGAEALDPGLAISPAGSEGQIGRADDDYRYGYWGWWHFNNIEYRDERVVFTSSFLPAGTYQYSYTFQAALPGQYQVIPTTAREQFFPDVYGRSEGMLFIINE